MKQDIKRYKDSVRIIKLFHAYGMFILNASDCYRNLETFDKEDISPSTIVDRHAQWKYTPQGFGYWEHLNDIVKYYNVKIFQNKSYFDSFVNDITIKEYF